MARRKESPPQSRVSREKQEALMIAQWREKYRDAEDDMFVFPPQALLFNAFFDSDNTVCVGVVPAEYFELTGHMYDQSFLIKGLDEEIWFETMEGVWETETYETLKEAIEELEELGMRHTPRIENPFADEEDDTTAAIDFDGDDDDDADTDVNDLEEDDGIAREH